MLTVAIPVGPFPANQRWLGECLKSVAAQTRLPDEVLLIEDMAGLDGDQAAVAYFGKPAGMAIYNYGFVAYDCTYADAVEAGRPQRFLRSWRSPWRLGVAHAFNFGVALARNDLIFLLGSDDYLEPDCLEACIAAWEKNRKADAYYFVGVRYLDGRKDDLQTTPCNAAMVTKGLWRETGGFPPESASGAPDAALISILMKHRPKALVPVEGGRPLYNYRAHGETDTAGRGPWQGIIVQTRNVLTATWSAPKWGRSA